MNKNYLKIGSLVAVVVVLVLCLSRFSYVTDRFNPFISEAVSYAQVPKGTQQYRNVQIYNPKTKKLVPYSLNKVGGYDPEGQYISITHKGQYVKSIKYISKKEFMKAKNN